MATVLITQCLQRDFVDPIGPHDPLPNLLHVGYSEATRLLGPEPAAGPLAQLIQWARGLPSDAIDLVHIRDWHDAADPAQREHLARFGAHCIKDTIGARLVLEMDQGAEAAANECIVDSITLNDLEGTDLEEQLDRIRREHGGEPLRVGVVGVWTEAKVSFLLYELRTRLGIDELATCSALTASASRTQHFNALSQLDKILGVSCFDSLADFVDWLRPGAELDLPRHPLGFEPRIGGGEAAALQDGDRSIVAHLFRDSTEVDLDPLHGGYSEATVWRAVSRDALGQQHAPAVVKLGPNRSIAQERVAFEQVEDVLGNNAPRVRGFVDLGDRAGLKYSYAAMGQGGVRTLQSMFAADVPTRQLASLVQTAFDEILGPLYAAARYERLPLFSHYQFSADKAPHVRAAVAALVPDATRTTARVPRRTRAAERLRLLRRVPQRAPLSPRRTTTTCRTCTAISTRPTSWSTRTTTCGSSTSSTPVVGTSSKIWRSSRTTCSICSRPSMTTPNCERRSRSPSPSGRSPIWAHRLPTFPMTCGRRTSSERGRFSGCCGARSARSATTIATRCSTRWPACATPFTRSAFRSRRGCRSSRRSSPRARSPTRSLRTVEANLVLRVDWVESPHIGPGRLGMTICPGRRDRDRDLEADLARLRAEGVDRLLCLSTDAELDWAGVPDLGSRAEAFGLNYRWLPVPDQGTCSLSEAVDLVGWCRDGLKRGESVVVTCMGGLGRSGMIAACTLVDVGVSPTAAIASVRAARGPRALETSGQEELVSRFAAS